MNNFPRVEVQETLSADSRHRVHIIEPIEFHKTTTDEGDCEVPCDIFGCPGPGTYRLVREDKLAALVEAAELARKGGVPGLIGVDDFAAALAPFKENPDG